MARKKPKALPTHKCHRCPTVGPAAEVAPFYMPAITSNGEHRPWKDGNTHYWLCLKCHDPAHESYRKKLKTLREGHYG